jgi:hypothetical protein
MHGVHKCHTAGSLVMMSWAATPGFARRYVSATSAMCWACPAPPPFVICKLCHLSIKDEVVVQRPPGSR